MPELAVRARVGRGGRTSRAPGSSPARPALQSQDQFQIQLHAHACCQLNDQVEPSVKIQFHVQVQVPVEAATGVAEALLAAALGAGAADGLCQIQFQVEPPAEAAVGSLPSVGGVHCPSHTQFHSHVPSAGNAGRLQREHQGDGEIRTGCRRDDALGGARARSRSRC